MNRRIVPLRRPRRSADPASRPSGDPVRGGPARATPFPSAPLASGAAAIPIPRAFYPLWCGCISRTRPRRSPMRAAPRDCVERRDRWSRPGRGSRRTATRRGRRWPAWTARRVFGTALGRTLCRMPSPSATHTAFADRTRIAARRTETTHSGSYVALRTNAAEPAVGRMSGIALTSRLFLARSSSPALVTARPGRRPTPAITGVRAPIVPERCADCTY
jgi:hypothetical protein